VIAGVDAYGTLSGAPLAAAGRRFACRYISGNNPLSMTEARDLTSHGIGIVSLYEVSPIEALGGEQAGALAGRAALLGAELGTGRIRMPRGSVVIFAADFDVQQSDRDAVLLYWREAGNAIRDAGLLAGAYGPQSIVEAAVVFGWVPIGMVAAGWRSAPKISPRIQLVQTVQQIEIGGVTCDQDIATTTHFGAWNLAGLWPPAQEEGVEMRIAHSSAGAAFVVSGSRKMPVDGAHWPAIAAQQLPAVEMDDAELALLDEVAWGAL